MGNIIVLSFIYLVGISLLLAFNELNYRRLNLKGEFTRKIAHFSATLATIPFPYIFPSHWYVLVLALLFFGVLYITKYMKQLESIHNIERMSIGSYLLPISIYVTFLISFLFENKLIYILPIVILAVCDPIAAILGINVKNFNGRIKMFGYTFNKTWLGSGGFFVTSFVISLIALYFHHNAFDLKTFWLAFVVAFAGTLAELFSLGGTDNLTIPLSVVLILVVFL